MTIDEVVRRFHAFLQASLPVVAQVPGMQADDGLKADWLQANWETLVEAPTRENPREFLEVYGDGADCNGASSRVWYPQAMPTHRISCGPAGTALRDVLSGETLAERLLPFDRFVGWDGNQYNEASSLNFVMLERGGTPVIVGVDEVVFVRARLPCLPRAG
jgi:hypothetical protein